MDAGLDLRPLLGAMTRAGIRFRVNEESGSQVIWVSTELEVSQAAQLLEEWEKLQAQGAFVQQRSARSRGLSGYFPVGNYVGDLLRAALVAPVTIVLLVAALIVAGVSQLGADLRPVEFMFYPTLNPGAVGGLPTLLSILGDMQGLRDFVRTLTPALLHFGAVHLVFNAMWLWHFGRMIESTQSSVLYLFVVFLIAFISNTTQYVWSMSANFGGLSGVVYGLLGYIWMCQTVNPASRLRLPPAMIGFMLVALVLMEVFASAWIATAAHAGGLVAGMVAGIVIALIHRFRK